jgi:hypothetical protein
LKIRRKSRDILPRNSPQINPLILLHPPHRAQIIIDSFGTFRLLARIVHFVRLELFPLEGARFFGFAGSGIASATAAAAAVRELEEDGGGSRGFFSEETDGDGFFLVGDVVGFVGGEAFECEEYFGGYFGVVRRKCR